MSHLEDKLVEHLTEPPPTVGKNWAAYSGCKVVVCDDVTELPKMVKHMADVIICGGRVVKSTIGGLK